jgi:hypothetical protein
VDLSDVRGRTGKNLSRDGSERRELVAPSILRTMRDGEFEALGLRQVSLAPPRRDFYLYMILTRNLFKP